MNLKHDGNIYNYPLYLISRFPQLEELDEKMKGSVHFKGDITKPIGEEWDADI
jgi:hypothetical protein